MADPALTVEQRERLTELFNEHLFEINLEGDNLVFYAECEDLELAKRNELLAGVHTVEEIARVLCGPWSHTPSNSSSKIPRTMMKCATSYSRFPGACMKWRPWSNTMPPASAR